MTNSNLATIKVQNGMAIIRVPINQAFELSVALSPCPCRSTKSKSTASIRNRFAKALAHALETRNDG